jgi:hypothetical protein
MELRMYGLVNYQNTGIQKGIQFLHSVVEYSQMANRLGNDILKQYNEWADNHKTVILLNGGTTNNKILEDGKYFGTLNNHKKTLDNLGVFNSGFNEPDLGDQLTAVAFLLDERIFNKKKYPDFKDWLIENYEKCLKKDMNLLSSNSVLEIMKNSESSKDKKVYKKWIKLIGGEKNYQIREFIKNFHLA